MDQIEFWRSWIGRSEEQEEILDPWPALAMAAIFDRDDLKIAPGAKLPIGWQWAYFKPVAPQHSLGPDGHAPRGQFSPPIDLKRRLWAGCRMKCEAPLTIGRPARLTSKIADVSLKQGRSGRLVFLTVARRFVDDRGGSLEDEATVVYRDAEMPNRSDVAASSAAAELPKAQWQRGLVPDTRLLFRFAAVTFNAHRIHYDREYTVVEEGYPELVVPGPLTTLLLLDLVDRSGGARVAEFSCRALRPIYLGGAVTLSGEPGADPAHYRLWARAANGRNALEIDARHV